MPIATGLALGLGLAGALGGSAIGAIGSSKAADAQGDAANNAANLQYKLGQQSLDFQKQEFNTQQQNIAPWLQAGSGAIGQLSDLMKPGGQLATGWNQQFQAPTGVTEQNDPGYQFLLSQGLDALQNSAAARGGLLSGGTAKAIDQYAQSDASNEYGNVYNRALGQYQQNYNQFQNNQSNLYNRLAGISGAGQTATAQLGQSGSAAAGNIGNISGNIGAQVGNSMQSAGNAAASGYYGIGNAINSGISSGINQYTGAAQLSSLQALLGQNTNGQYNFNSSGYNSAGGAYVRPGTPYGPGY
jgi:hypothetical protein